MSDTFESVTAYLGIAVLIAMLGLVAVCLGTLTGAAIGWLLDWVGMGGWIRAGFESFGFHVGALWQVGAMLGFVAGFFGSKATYKKES